MAALYLANAAGDGWASTGFRRTSIKLRERNLERTFVVENGKTGEASLVEAGREKRDSGSLTAVTNKGRVRATFHEFANLVHVDINRGETVALFEDITYAAAEPKNTGGDGAVRAPMAGKIVRVNVDAGATVEKGQVLVILEAMKMEHEIVARAAGTVAAVNAKQGDQVAARQVLVTLST